MTTNATPRGFPASHNADRDAGQSLRAGIEALDDGFTLWDAHDRLVLANARYLEIFPVLVGWLRPGRSFVECIREIAQRMYAQLPVAARDGFIAESVKQHGARVASRDHIRPDGTTLRVIERPTGDGGTVTIYRDVTSEQRAAERLARSEAQFRDGILSMADGFVLWGPDRRLRTWNDQLLQIMPHLRSVLAVDMTLAEFIEAACNAAYPDWSKSQRQDWTRDRLVSAWTSSHRADLELADDRFVTITQNRTSDGGLVATYRDMTTEVRATRRLVDSESGSRRLALAATNVQSGIVILDSRSRITWTNPAMAGMVGISPDALLGLTPRAAFISDQTPPESFARIAEALNSRQRARADLVLRRPDGTTFWVELDAAPIFNDDGTLDSIVGLHTDISERKLHQEQLERALVVAREMNEDQRRFVAIASHEFRTPLTIIDGAAQRIAAHLRATKADESIPRRLGRIRAAVARMTGVIELMLSSARLDDGKLHLAPGPVNVTALLREVCDRQGQITPQFTIVTEQCPSDLIIEADGRLLDQVFTNLLSNAAKYSGSSQRIEICAKRQPGLVVVEIRDFGIGISAADLPRMFTRFFRAKSASGIQGTGIGLHFTRQLVLLHGGSIDVESELGRGSVFRVALPTTQAAALRSGLVAE